MALIIAIRVDDKQDIVAGPTNRLHPDFAVVAAVIPLAGRVVETEPSLPPGAKALGLVPFKDHNDIYALSVVRSTRMSSECD